MASLPPSMLNMGWEYPAHLLQGPDPLPTPRGTAARGAASQQPNNVVSLSCLLSGTTLWCYSNYCRQLEVAGCLMRSMQLPLDVLRQDVQ